MRTDQCGYQVTGASPVGVERLDAAVRSLLLVAGEVGDAWEAAVAEDPAFALGHIGHAHLRCLASEAPDAVDARAILENVGDGHELSDRERRHLDGAHAYATGRHDDAVRAMYPIRRIAHRFGGSNAQRDVVARTVLEAAIRGGGTLAHVLASERFAIKESSSYKRRQLDRAPHPDACTAPAAVALV